MPRDTISTNNAATPAGPPFSPAVRSGGLLFLSGQVAEDPATGGLLDGDVAAQTRQIFANIGRLLHAAGRSLEDVVRVGVYLTDMDDYAAMNEAYAEQFQRPYPARTAVAVAALPLDARIEIDMVVG